MILTEGDMPSIIHEPLKPGWQVNWQPESACFGQDPEVFYFEDLNRVTGENIKDAKAICETCIYKDQCLDRGRENHTQYFGVYGGELLGPKILPNETEENPILALSEQAAVFLQASIEAEPPRFDPEDQRQADEVRRAMREAFGGGKLPKEMQVNFGVLQNLLNPAAKIISTSNGSETEGEGTHMYRGAEPFYDPNMNCVGKDPMLFYFEEERDITPENLAMAKAICAACEVKVECLDWGKKHHSGKLAIFGEVVLTGDRKISKRYN